MMKESIEEVGLIMFTIGVVCLMRGRLLEARDEMKYDSGRG
jgi:hypothetical protein